ncbi:MAG: GIY-YIG nuclease family protein [Candidatus Pelagibacter sp.]
MAYFVYLIISKNPKKQFISYVGYTNNLKDRINKHNSSKGAKFTRGRLWKLAYSKRYESKNIALKEEYKLKVNYKLRNLIKKKFIKNENFSSTSI